MAFCRQIRRQNAIFIVFTSEKRLTNQRNNTGSCAWHLRKNK